MAGRASSKDWKRSIRYAGRPLQCLIHVRLNFFPPFCWKGQGDSGQSLPGTAVQALHGASAELCVMVLWGESEATCWFGWGETVFFLLFRARRGEWFCLSGSCLALQATYSHALTGFGDWCWICNLPISGWDFKSSRCLLYLCCLLWWHDSGEL